MAKKDREFSQIPYAHRLPEVPGIFREKLEREYLPNKKVPVQREVFRYEHPDLEREGLCFISET